MDIQRAALSENKGCASCREGRQTIRTKIELSKAVDAKFIRDSSIFKGGCPWRNKGEGHVFVFVIVMQGSVIQFYLSPMEGVTIFVPFELQKGFAPS